MDYQVILFDFDGVLCRERFYEKSLLPEYPGAYSWIQKNIFGNRDLIRQWMRNRVSSAEINELIAQNAGISYEILDKLYKDSVFKMNLEKEVMDLAASLKQSGRKIGIVTDNMDVFSQITIPNHRLDELFDVVVNSADYGILKKDEEGRLFDAVLDLAGGKIENSLMIDDSELNIEFYKRKGGQGFVYNNFADLKSFFANYANKNRQESDN